MYVHVSVCWCVYFSEYLRHFKYVEGVWDIVRTILAMTFVILTKNVRLYGCIGV